MKSKSLYLISAVALIAGCLSPLALLSAEPFPKAEFPDDTLFLNGALSGTELAEHSGREELKFIQQSDLRESATLTDNTVISSVNGANIISRSAFSNAMGHTTAIQNSGNHVIIQDSTIYNVTVIP